MKELKKEKTWKKKITKQNRKEGNKWGSFDPKLDRHVRPAKKKLPDPLQCKLCWEFGGN